MIIVEFWVNSQYHCYSTFMWTNWPRTTVSWSEVVTGVDDQAMVADELDFKELWTD